MQKQNTAKTQVVETVRTDGLDQVEPVRADQFDLLEQDLGVPASVQRDLVVRNNQRAALRCVQMRQPDHRHLGQPEALEQS